jgi:hypothetical protein
MVLYLCEILVLAFVYSVEVHPCFLLSSFITNGEICLLDPMGKVCKALASVVSQRMHCQKGFQFLNLSKTLFL